MTNDDPVLIQENQAALLQVADASIEYGLCYHQPLPVAPADYPAPLQMPRAVFVTLTLHSTLRGCVGTLDSGQPLVVNTAKYAYAAAFSDTRFSPLTRDEYSGLNIHISLLSALETLPCSSENDLLAKIRPGLDGLLLEEGGYRGTLLPSVWQDIPEPREFLRRLKMKAGLPPGYWSQQLQVRRYTAQSIPAD